MIYRKHIPKYPLGCYIDSILYIEGNNKGTGLPKTAMSLVFNLNDSFKLYTDKELTEYTDYKRYWVAGLQLKPTVVESYGTSKMIVIQFKTIGAFFFLNQPLHYFTDYYINLDDIFHNEANETWEKLKEAQSLNEMLLITENFLYQKFLEAKMPKEAFLRAVESLLQNIDSTPIHKICNQFGVSRKHLNFLFKEYSGVSPKTLSSLHRFQNVLKKINQTKPDKLTDFAYEFEYYDQAHFNNDFKRYTGLKPTEYSKLVETEASLKIIPHFLPLA